jgi:uncharacterized protein (UPF0332 family)
MLGAPDDWRRVFPDEIPSRVPFFRKASQTYCVALHAYDGGLIDSAASRLYYTAFQVARALIAAEWNSDLVRSVMNTFQIQQRSVSHIHVKAVMAKLFGPATDHLFTNLRQERLTADYQEGSVRRENVRVLWTCAIGFIREVGERLEVKP